MLLISVQYINFKMLLITELIFYHILAQRTARLDQLVQKEPLLERIVVVGAKERV